MKKRFFTLIMVLTIGQIAYPCSSFVLKKNDKILLGKNFDWTFGEGYLIKNLRNTTKYAYYSHSGQPANWTSKYGSITFNQNGKEMPYGGMNEKGLVVEMLWLEDTQYNLYENKNYLNELEWIQYQLDNYETVDEVRARMEDLKIYPLKGKIHYLLADRNGKSIIIEYISGRAIIYEKEPNTCQAITNKTVKHSEKYIDNLKNIPKRNTSETFRYHQLEKQIAKLDKTNQVTKETAFQLLKNVTIPKGNFKTMWSIVYDLRSLHISFFTHDHQMIKEITLSTLNFEEELSYFELNQNSEKKLNEKLKPFNEQINFPLMSASLTHLGFDTELSKDLSIHQFKQTALSASVFSKEFFHFNIIVPLLEDGKRFIFAVMDSKENFTARKAVVGGYYRLRTVITNYTIQIYGLKNGHYALFACIDDNRNNELDFNDSGQPIEKYTTFSNFQLKNKSDLRFENTSEYFDHKNATFTIVWQL